MCSIADMIEKFGGNTSFADVLGKRPSTVSEMKRRSSIPVEYWPRIVEAAEQKGISGLSYETLVQMHVPHIPARVSSTPLLPSDAGPRASEGAPSPRPSPARGEGEECEATA
jgi:hypothetical protein